MNEAEQEKVFDAIGLVWDRVWPWLALVLMVWIAWDMFTTPPLTGEAYEAWAKANAENIDSGGCGVSSYTGTPIPCRY